MQEKDLQKQANEIILSMIRVGNEPKLRMGDYNVATMIQAELELKGFLKYDHQLEVEALKKEVGKYTRYKFSDVKGMLQSEIDSQTFSGAVSTDGEFTGKVNLNRLNSTIQEFLNAKVSDIKTEEITKLKSERDKLVELHERAIEHAEQLLSEGDILKQEIADQLKSMPKMKTERHKIDLHDGYFYTAELVGVKGMVVQGETKEKAIDELLTSIKVKLLHDSGVVG